MEHSSLLAGLVQERINDTILVRRSELEPLGPDTAHVLDEAAAFLTGGKRFRAQFAWLGFLATHPVNLEDPNDEARDVIVNAACALELFHAAALVHDDIIDRSDTRRGRQAAHRAFASLHEQNHWRDSPDHFGLSAALLLGDLLQTWADDFMQAACDTLATQNSAHAKRAREHFTTMRTEVALGQYLDVLEEQRADFAEHAEQLERSTRVLIYKSAKYSVEAPLLIGAALAGATKAQEESLTAFGLPIGVAFQLRDDLLGVFGNEELTGKPAGDDLAEGKRTVLVAFSRQHLPQNQLRVFDELLGTDLDRDQIGMLQRAICDSGAVELVEQSIERNVNRANEALDAAEDRGDIDPAAAAALRQLAKRATQRAF